MAEKLLFNSPHLLQKISLSPVLLRLMREAVKAEPDVNALAETVRLDPALAATLLNLVNSAFYGLPQKVKDLNRAVAVLGSRELLKVAVAMTLQKDMARNSAGTGYDFAPDWRLIVWSSIAAELIAGRLCPRRGDHAYLCCLLKDISLLFLRCAAGNMLVDPGRREGVTVLAPRQLEREIDAWGMHHGALSQLLLTRWGLPSAMCPSIRRHHALDALAEQEPLTQAVILATRWSELELGRSEDPMGVVQFAMLLRGVLDMSEGELDALRDQCRERFRSMLASIGLDEGDPGRAYYVHSVRTMQDYCFLCMALLTAEGGLPSVARILGRHIRLNWDVAGWDLALKTPHGERYALFHLDSDGGLRQEEGLFCFGRLPWRITRAGWEMTSAGQRLGELRFDAPGALPDQRGEIALYLRFFAQGYAQYCARQAVLEEKALAFDAVPIGVARLDGMGTVTEANRKFNEFLHLDCPAEGKSFAALLARRLPPTAAAEFSSFLASAGRRSFGKIEYLPEEGDAGEAAGGAFYLSVHRGEREAGALALVEDLRELSGAEEQMLRRKNFLERLVGAMQELVLTVAAGVIEFSSRPELALAGRRFAEVFRPLRGGSEWAGDPLVDQPPAPIEAALRSSGGSELPYELSFSPLGPGRSGGAVLVVGRDLTRIRRLEAELRLRATFDSLTGLFNHYQFHTVLEREVERSRRTGRGLGLIFFDLDRFKAVNDSGGHLAGDAALKAIGAILRHEVRKGMDYACRYGGDEFALIVAEVDEAGLRKIGERILTEVRREFKGRVSVSLGYSPLTAGDTAESLLRRVDDLSYQAKRAGGDALVGPGV